MRSQILSRFFGLATLVLAGHALHVPEARTATQKTQDVDQALAEFEDFVTSLRLHTDAILSGETLKPLLIQQYDVCAPGVFHCAPEVLPTVDLDAYEAAVLDPFYGYRVFILVDKSKSTGPGKLRSPDAPHPQTMHVFVRHGNELRFHSVHPVSTGAEPRPHSKDTREGYMRVQNAQRNYTSIRYGEAMPFSLWFESEYGTAIHQTRQDWCDKSIGSRASAGCVRLCPDVASTVFNLVADLGKSHPIVLLDKRSGVPIRMGTGSQKTTLSETELLSLPKVINGFPAFVRVIDVNTPEKQAEIESLIRRPTEAFKTYFKPLATSARQQLGI